ncbi:MAG: hypothetical protein ACYCZD_04490 [Rhodanobacter sp.]
MKTIIPILLLALAIGAGAAQATESVSRIDKARFDRLSARAMHHGSAADQPTTLPAH